MEDTAMEKSTEIVVLGDLAKRINATYLECGAIAKTALEHALEVGRLLLQAKDQVGHGEWASWVMANCAFTERSASRYMRLAANKDQLPKSDTVSDLTLRGAMDLLTAPKAEPTTSKRLTCDKDEHYEPQNPADEGVEEPEVSKPKPAPKAKAPETDKVGCHFPKDNPGVAEAFANAVKITHLMTMVKALKSAANAEREAGDKVFAFLNFQEIQLECENIHRAFRFAKPYAEGVLVRAPPVAEPLDGAILVGVAAGLARRPIRSLRLAKQGALARRGAAGKRRAPAEALDDDPADGRVDARQGERGEGDFALRIEILGRADKTQAAFLHQVIPLALRPRDVMPCHVVFHVYVHQADVVLDQFAASFIQRRPGHGPA